MVGIKAREIFEYAAARSYVRGKFNAGLARSYAAGLLSAFHATGPEPEYLAAVCDAVADFIDEAAE